jgi:hypothetical protein
VIGREVCAPLGGWRCLLPSVSRCVAPVGSAPIAQVLLAIIVLMLARRARLGFMLGSVSTRINRCSMLCTLAAPGLPCLAYANSYPPTRCAYSSLAAAHLTSFCLTTIAMHSVLPYARFARVRTYELMSLIIEEDRVVCLQSSNNSCQSCINLLPRSSR